MTRLDNFLKRQITKLTKAGIPTARLDCLVLLEDATGKDRSWLLAHPEFVIQDRPLETLNEWVEQRVLHKPLAYIRGKSEFYGREFLVNPHTLEPRPETETMIDLVKSLVKTRENSVIVDVGTGSGCIAISVKLEIPNQEVLATDIDVKCIETARENSKILDANVTFYNGNLLEPIIEDIDIILCNLPYVPDRYELNEAAKFEPKHAIFGGEDGLDIYRHLFGQIVVRKLKAKSPKYILTESLPFQHKGLANIAENAGFSLLKTNDFIQIFIS